MSSKTKASAQRLKILLVLVALLGLAAPALGAREARPSTWNERVQESDALLRAGEYAKARKITERLLLEMGSLLLASEKSDRVLGSASALHALALSGLGESRDAEWYWYLGQALKEDLGATSLTGYGEAGRRLEPVRDAATERLEAVRKREEEPLPEPGTPVTSPSCAELRPPVKVKAPKPEYPPEIRKAGIVGAVRLSLVIDENGLPTRPIVLAAPAPSLAWASAEAVRRWKFKPARCDGRPAAVYYNLTVNMSLRAAWRD